MFQTPVVHFATPMRFHDHTTSICKIGLLPSFCFGITPMDSRKEDGNRYRGCGHLLNPILPPSFFFWDCRTIYLSEWLVLCDWKSSYSSQKELHRYYFAKVLCVGSFPRNLETVQRTSFSMDLHGVRRGYPIGRSSFAPFWTRWYLFIEESYFCDWVDMDAPS